MHCAVQCSHHGCLSGDSGHCRAAETGAAKPACRHPAASRPPRGRGVPGGVARQSAEAALAYIDLKPGQKLIGTPIDTVFIGSCTNGRIEDFREAARVAKGRKVAPGVQALAVPGSMAVREMAEAEGIAKILSDAGFEWRLPGCSMCRAMNDDRAEEGSRVASPSNRNFVGRQGKGSRTHLMSPASAAAAAIAGAIADPRDYL